MVIKVVNPRMPLSPDSLHTQPPHSVVGLQLPRLRKTMDYVQARGGKSANAPQPLTAKYGVVHTQDSRTILENTTSAQNLLFGETCVQRIPQ